MNKPIYNVNWFRLVREYLLPPLRLRFIMAFINSCTAPINSAHKSFMIFRKDANYRVMHNSQICYLQKMLNDKFDNSLRRIKVQNVPPRIPLWVYYPEDDKPKYIYNEEDEKTLFLYNTGDYYNEFDFEVTIPLVLLEFENQMKAQINYYKLYSKNYKITTL